jgi:hypothetical protein
MPRGGFDIPMTPSEIQAAYVQMVNTGQNAVLQISRPHLSLGEWRDEQLKIWAEYSAQCLY